MVKHIIMWKFKDELSETEKEVARKGIKEGLEGLKGKIPGLLDIRVQTQFLETSNVDALLDSTFENDEALKEYAKNELHNEVADSKVRPFIKARMCMDYEV